MESFWGFLVLAILNCGAGWLVRRFPNMIAGYNSMSREQKKSVDIDGLSRFMQWMLAVSGFGSLVVYSLMWWLVGEGETTNFAALGFFMVVIIFGVIYAQKFDSKSKIGKIWKK